MTTMQRWSGVEVKALREAKRMSLHAFARYLGVSERSVSKWEAGGAALYPRPANQEALDTVLGESSSEVHTRFLGMTATHARPSEYPSTAQLDVDDQPVTHAVDGKLMAPVSAGLFLSGARNRPVRLARFYIDVYPVTNGDYDRFIAATGHQSPQHWTTDQCPESLLNHPVVFVTWHDAMAYARWAGKSLPTSQQWEKAARGADGDTYPWGGQSTPAKCNVRDNQTGSTTPVDQYHSGVSPYGVYDLCGNAWEWCSTETTSGRYELKGSAFTSPFFRAAPATFNDAASCMLDDDTSFRCVDTLLDGFD